MDIPLTIGLPPSPPLVDLAGELQCVGSFHAHGLGINNLKCVSMDGGGGHSVSASSRGPTLPPQPLLVLSAGKDHMVRLWRVVPGSVAPDLDGSGSRVVAEASSTLVASYSGHVDSVEGLALSPNREQCCSCGWDGAVFIWRSGQDVLDEATAAAGSVAAGTKASAKKRKKAAGAGALVYMCGVRAFECVCTWARPLVSMHLHVCICMCACVGGWVWGGDHACMFVSVFVVFMLGARGQSCAGAGGGVRGRRGGEGQEGG